MRKKTFFNLRVGRPHTSPTKPSHVPGVPMGNDPGRYPRTAGMRRTGDGRLLVNARRSTGINARRRNPIDPNSPHLSPP
ncbi:MAG TPA: hypothetical protein VKY51_07475 [Fredinandcohnia sp.]|nr:hypothetical protein [Fredinandcohnia sp.]